MPDSRARRIAQTRQRINPAEGYELNYWTRQLHCTEQQLMGAIKTVGPDVDQVKAYLAHQPEMHRTHFGCA